MTYSRARYSVGVILAALLVAATAVALVIFASTKADAAPQFRVVTRTFVSNAQITITDGGPATPYPSSRNVAGFNRGRILDVNLVLRNFTHEVTRDVDVMLSHRGVERTVLSDAGRNVGGSGDSVNNITVRLDDQAPNTLVEGEPLTAGSFKPANLQGTNSDTFPPPAPPQSGQARLAGFNGIDPNGGWRLWVVDDFLGGSGQIAGGWTLTIKARVPR